MANQLTDLSIHEVSLVDRGAIGEVFTLLKSENINPDILKQYDMAGMMENLKSLPEQDFINIMENMMSKYKEINKGGTNNMDEQVKAVLEEITKTMNTNFASINKSIDEIKGEVELQKKATQTAQEEADAKAKAEADAKAKAEEDAKKSQANDETQKALGTVAETLKSITGALEGLGTKFDDVSKRLENLENTPNPSNNGGSADPIQKGDKQPEVFWKSFFQKDSQE